MLLPLLQLRPVQMRQLWRRDRRLRRKLPVSGWHNVCSWNRLQRVLRWRI